MSLGVLLAVLGAALLHAIWNALIKMGTSKVGTMVILSVVEIPIGLGIAAVSPPMAWAAVPWAIAAGCTHFAYKYFLTFAYDRGDLSRVYPIARGAAPLVVTLAGLFLLSDPISNQQYLAIALLGGGILLMARGIFAQGENRKMLPFALGSACATATYTMIDGMGGRISGAAGTYVAWVFVADGLIFSLGMMALRGRSIVPKDRRAWVLGTVGSVASYGAYAISIWAMTFAPIPVVAALRETSILFAMLIGWIWFRERMDGTKVVAALVIVGGVLMLRI